MMYLAPLTVAPGRATWEVFSLVSGALMSSCTKLYVLIIELYGIAGVMNIVLDVTFFMCCTVDL